MLFFESRSNKNGRIGYYFLIFWQWDFDSKSYLSEIKIFYFKQHFYAYMHCIYMWIIHCMYMWIISWFTLCLGCAIMISRLNQPLLVHKHEQIEPFVSNIKYANSWLSFWRTLQTLQKLILKKRHLNPRHLMCNIFLC